MSAHARFYSSPHSRITFKRSPRARGGLTNVTRHAGGGPHTASLATRGAGSQAAPRRYYCVGGGPTLLMSTLPMKKGKASTARARGTRTTAEAVMPGRRKKEGRAVRGRWRVGTASSSPACTEPPRVGGAPTLAGPGQPCGAALRCRGGVRRPPCRVWVPPLCRLLPPGAHADVEAVHLLGLVLARHAACPRRGPNA